MRINSITLPSGQIRVYGVEDIETRSGNIGNILELFVNETTWKNLKRGETMEAWDPETHSVVLVTKWMGGKARHLGVRCRGLGFLTFSTKKGAENFAERASR